MENFQNVLIFSKRVVILYEVLRKCCNCAFDLTGEIISLNLIEEILPVWPAHLLPQWGRVDWYTPLARYFFPLSVVCFLFKGYVVQNCCFWNLCYIRMSKMFGTFGRICECLQDFFFQAREAGEESRNFVFNFFSFSLLQRACCWVTQLLYQLMHIYKIYKLYTLKH